MRSRTATDLISAVGGVLSGTRAGRLLILVYHRVRADPDPMYPDEVDARRFDAQMALLSRHCRPFALPEGVRRLLDRSLPPRAVAVTFDDGYADNATVALPILQQRGIPATFFVAPGFLDGGRMWNDTIIETVRRAPESTIDLSDFGMGVVSLGDVAGRGAIAEAIIGSVKHLPPEVRLAHVESLCNRMVVDLPDDLMMTSGQVSALASAGMDVGAHTMTHPILRTLSDGSARREIESSRQVLERITAAPVRAFAYPNGRPFVDYSTRDRALVQQLGFDFACSTTAAVADPDSDVYQLPRFTPWDRGNGRWFMRLLATFGRTHRSADLDSRLHSRGG